MRTPNSQRRRRRKRDKNLDKYLMGAIAYIVCWSVAFFAAWLALKMEPGILEGCILAPGVVEMVMCAWIKKGKQGEDPGSEINPE